MTEEKPIFPITVKWLEDGESEVFADMKELECTLEWFDTDDHEQGAVVTDNLGRRVRLKIEKLQIVQFHLADEEDP